MSSKSVSVRIPSFPGQRTVNDQAEATASPGLGTLGRPVALTLAAGVATFAILGALVVLLRDDLHYKVGEFGRLFDLDAEQNLSTWFQVIQLFCASLLAGIVAFSRCRMRDRNWIYWTGVALVLGAFSADELAGMHERLSLYVSWLRLAKYFVVLIGLVYVRFWWSLPVRFRLLLLAACAVYFGSVLGLEVISFKFWNPDATHRLTYAIISVFEETGEMTGAWLFFATMLAYLRYTGVDLRIHLSR